MVTPSLLIIPLVHFVGRRMEHPRVIGGLHTVVISSAGLLLAASIPLARDALTDPLTIGIATATVAFPDGTYPEFSVRSGQLPVFCGEMCQKLRDVEQFARDVGCAIHVHEPERFRVILRLPGSTIAFRHLHERGSVIGVTLYRIKHDPAGSVHRMTPLRSPEPRQGLYRAFLKRFLESPAGRAARNPQTPCPVAAEVKAPKQPKQPLHPQVILDPIPVCRVKPVSLAV
jgi:hypothetical protein